MIQQIDYVKFNFDTTSLNILPALQYKNAKGKLTFIMHIEAVAKIPQIVNGFQQSTKNCANGYYVRHNLFDFLFWRIRRLLGPFQYPIIRLIV